ncbi:hypothetical protein BKK79_27960 [Cupriavidus sp. USMAA2-4]|uniref:tetratricopeptide repeat protein n=1 Tax=Cupriavidus sp. USMAA2-4 TaxID=876364 RepID=UPI0008A6CD68|nr:tetratricopeptide repeat protein [Cupriavidus sp. USMAA2-4]AOY95574.1 hypothetical protein BKK79_27960 [Cupriavidus sp. USMAA2-4]
MRKITAEFKLAIEAYDAHDNVQAFRLMEECANEGDPAACFLAALWCKRGEGTDADPERSAFWISRLAALARRGDLDAQWNLSCMRRWGNEVIPRNVKIANRWLERAAEGGHGQAQHHLAWYYESGQYGYPIDLARANAWYERALKQEDPETLYLFAMREFRDGKPTEAAIGLLKRAAANGFSQAIYVLEEFGR